MAQQKHGVSLRIISRGPNVWEGKCGRHATFTGADYADVEDKWREHVWQETGVAPTPTRYEGTTRWEVPA